MKYLKNFNESIKDDNLIRDINGILIELIDQGIKVNVESGWSNNTSRRLYKNKYKTRDIKTFRITIGSYSKPFTISSIKDYIETLFDYIRYKHSNFTIDIHASVRFNGMNYIIFDKNLSEVQEIDKEFNYIEFNIKLIM